MVPPSRCSKAYLVAPAGVRTSHWLRSLARFVIASSDFVGSTQIKTSPKTLQMFVGPCGCALRGVRRPIWLPLRVFDPLARSFRDRFERFRREHKNRKLFLQTSNAHSLTKRREAPFYHVTRQRTRSPLLPCKAQHHVTPFRHRFEQFCKSPKNRHIVSRTSNVRSLI